MNAYPAQKLDADGVRIRIPPVNLDGYAFVNTQEILQGKGETAGVPECIGRRLSRRQTERYTGAYQMQLAKEIVVKYLKHLYHIHYTRRFDTSI